MQVWNFNLKIDSKSKNVFLILIIVIKYFFSWPLFSCFDFFRYVKSLLRWTNINCSYSFCHNVFLLHFEKTPNHVQNIAREKESIVKSVEQNFGARFYFSQHRGFHHHRSIPPPFPPPTYMRRVYPVVVREGWLLIIWLRIVVPH